jgi:hypothetical protein
MKFAKATRKKCKMKLSLQGPSGSGKTYSALLIAKGITGNLSKVAVIDTENGSSNLYAKLGAYSVLNLEAPFTPEKYIEAIKCAKEQGFECVIIDSLSHEWFGTGGILEIHSNMQGNSFTNWSKLTPRHNALIETIVGSDIHILATLRSKTEYVIQQVNGKNVPEKVGLKSVQRDDTEYEFTISFELNKNYMAVISKDRTELFKNQPELVLTEHVGKKIIHWCNSDDTAARNEDVRTRIMKCDSLSVLDELYAENPELRDLFREEFASKQEDLLFINQEKFRQNGHYQH